MVVRIQIAFKTIQTPDWEIEGKEDHLTVIELHNKLSWTQVWKNWKLERFGNLRDFYFFQDHTTSSYKWWGKTRIRIRAPRWGDYSFLRDHHQPSGCPPVQQRPQPKPGSKGCHPSQDNRRSSCKGDGKGSCAISGSSQWQKHSCNSDQP